MSLDKSSPEVLWKRFNELAAMSDAERQEVYCAGGSSFLKSLIAVTMINCPAPEIGDAEEFSNFIVELRGNYRLWNQHLMGLMVALETTKQGFESLEDFISTCPWKELSEAAQNFLDSKGKSAV